MTLRRIVCFGDSLTEGWIKNGLEFYPYTTKLKSLLNTNNNTKWIVVNEGCSGETTLQMVDRIKRVCCQHNFIDLLIIQGGTNDILQYQQPNVFESLLKVLDAVPNNYVDKICLLSIMEGYFAEEDGAVMSHSDGDKLRIETNRKLENYFCNKDFNNVFLCDMADSMPMFSLSEEQRKLYWDDLLHPSKEGYDKMADIIFEFINENIL